MKAADILNASSDGSLLEMEGIALESAKDVENSLCVGGLIPIPVMDVSSSLNQAVDLEVVGPDGTSLGTLCFLRPHDTPDVSTFSRWRFVAYLADCQTDDLLATTYQLKTAYLVVDEDKHDLYKAEFMHTAPLWGRFTHYTNNAPQLNGNQGIIRAIPGLHLPTPHHNETLSRYCRANNPLDRFLRLYHCIELLFDYVVVAKIRLLAPDLRGFPRILAEFGSTELDRLKGIMKEFCSDAERIAALLITSSKFRDQRQELFRLFSKSGDPLKDDSKWEKVLKALDSGDASCQQFLAAKIVRNPDEYRSIILDISAYWIYRVRSSIAHSRVGEYLLNDNSSAFVNDFAEPLLVEVVIQILSSARLKALSPP